MGLTQLVGAQYNAMVGNGNIRYVNLPIDAPVALVVAGATLAWAWTAAYTQIVAAAVAAVTIDDPSWLAGVSIHTAVVASHEGDLALAIGEAAAEVDIAHIPYSIALAGVTANLLVMNAAPLHWLPFPIRAAGQPRLAGRLRRSTAPASADGVSVKTVWINNLGE